MLFTCYSWNHPIHILFTSGATTRSSLHALAARSSFFKLSYSYSAQGVRARKEGFHEVWSSNCAQLQLENLWNANFLRALRLHVMGDDKARLPVHLPKLLPQCSQRVSRSGSQMQLFTISLECRKPALWGGQNEVCRGDVGFAKEGGTEDQKPHLKQGKGKECPWHWRFHTEDNVGQRWIWKGT